MVAMAMDERCWLCENFQGCGGRCLGVEAGAMDDGDGCLACFAAVGSGGGDVDAATGDLVELEAARCAMETEGCRLEAVGEEGLTKEGG